MDVLSQKYFAYNPCFYEKCLWFLKASADCIKINYHDNGKEDTYLYLHLIEISLIWSSTWLLLSGLKNNSPIRIIPWILIAIWSILTNQYFSAEIVIVSIYRITTNYFFGIYTLLIAILCFGFRIYCWLRILQFTFCYVHSTNEIKAE